MGLWEVQCDKTREKMKDKSTQLIDEVNESYKDAFELIIESAGIRDIYSPLT